MVYMYKRSKVHVGEVSHKRFHLRKIDGQFTEIDVQYLEKRKNLPTFTPQ